nr:MAG TPA: hypothetical protein [Caudoviricetes sp.]
MKTEAEQAQAMAELITNKDLLDDKGRLAGKVVFGADQLAVALVEAGYGDIYEYKIEIERQAKQIAEHDEWFKYLQEQRNKATEENGKLKRENYQLKEEYNNVFELLKAKQREIDRLKAEQVGVQDESRQMP